MNNSNLTISNVAKLANISVETIRYYQRIGLISKPEKPPSGYRHYPMEIISLLTFIQRAKQLGFTLAEISELLQLDTAECDKTRQIAKRKVGLIQQKITDLQSMSAALDELLKSCDINEAHTGCPIIKALSR